MLKNVPTVLSPELLKTLDEMGHGDEIVIGDGNFPSGNLGPKVIRADGLGGKALLDAILTMIPLDTYAPSNFLLMNTTNGDPTPTIWKDYQTIASEHDPNVHIEMLERYDFYERAKKAYAIIQTSESAVYANIILKKGVVH